MFCFGGAIACVDIAVEHNDTILFGERINEPWKGGWALCGGKMNPGESFEKTAARHIERDLGITITPDRPRFVCTDSWVWSRRAQPPQENGCHMQGTTYTVKLLKDEVERIQHKGDFGKIAWLDASTITTHQYIHPAHRKACLEILRYRHHIQKTHHGTLRAESRHCRDSVEKLPYWYILDRLE